MTFFIYRTKYIFENFLINKTGGSIGWQMDGLDGYGFGCKWMDKKISMVHLQFTQFF